MAKVLVVDDEEPIQELLRFNLEREGYAVLLAGDGLLALDVAVREKPDVIVLDLMLPGLDGLEICKRLKQRPETDGIPIIMLTARGTEVDRVLGLELGADDYVTKPFSPRELAARVKVQLRRQDKGRPVETDKETITAGHIIIRPQHYQVMLHGQPVSLTPKEFQLLTLLVTNRGRVMKRDFLLDQVWGYDNYVDTRTLDVHIRSLRQKVEIDPAQPYFIETVRGIGYRFREKD